MLKILGSLRFALILIASLGVLLTVSTVLESVHGTPFAQKTFYTAFWFDILLGFFWINIFCATLTRVPYKKHHIGFIVTHIGILTLLIGAFLSRLLGVEGQMTLFEGESKESILQEGYTLHVTNHEGETFQMDLPRSSPRKRGSIFTQVDSRLRGNDGKDLKFSILQIIPHAEENKFLLEGDAKTLPNHVVQATLSSQTLGFSQTFTLIENDPENPDGYFTDIGPAHLELKSESGQKQLSSPKIIIHRADGNVFSIGLSETLGREVPLADTGLMISNAHYYPHAKVANNALVDAPEGIPFNPAVEFEVHDPQGRVEHHTKFLLFPHFNSLRGGDKNNFFDLTVALDAPWPEGLEKEKKTPSFIFRVSKDDRWSYEILSSASSKAPEPLTLRKEIPTGWMDMTITAHQVFNRAIFSREIKASKNQSIENVAVEISVIKEDNTSAPRWVLTNRPLNLETKKGAVKITLRQKDRPVTFRLKLKDFRKVDYPGTTSPSSFESDVVLSDPKENMTLEKTIRMNKPLDYKSYRVFQSSYIQDEQFGEASVFSVAKNPGIQFIYSGAVIILIGVILLFYLHPFFGAGNGDLK